jgi:hypothetical protein
MECNRAGYLATLLLGIVVSTPALANGYNYFINSTFTNFSTKDLGTIDDTQIYVGFEMLNSTTVTWTDFHLAMTPNDDCLDDPGGTYDCVARNFVGPVGSDYDFGKIGDTQTLNIYDIEILSGQSLAFELVFFTPSGVGATWSLAAYPTTSGTAPQPATLALFGLGLAGIGAVRRRRIVNQLSISVALPTSGGNRSSEKTRLAPRRAFS